MENLLEELSNLANKHNKKLDSETIKTLTSILNLSDIIYEIANKLKNDPDSTINIINDGVEKILLRNQEIFLKSLKILNNIYYDKESNDFFTFNTFLYDVINSVFLNVGFSKGLSHFYALTIFNDLSHNRTSELASELTIDNLSLFSDLELDSLKLKNKLFSSLFELTTNKKFTSNLADKFIESIELSKQIKSLNDKPAKVISNSNFIDTTQKENKFETLKSNLYNNGFLELSKVRSLSHDGQSKLFELLVLNETPYNVAMFEFLGYFKYLNNELGLTNTKIHTKLSAFFNVDEQTIKCNMLVLNEKSKLRENIRYTSHNHKEKVKTDYYLLK